ncbi:hypothetical protein [Jiella avicenniae]|uniref:Uncharacterized protein n=1 Tax=Jiella avicenniae TaxID=2907202 RepID=A0A9X1T7K7_9HYPH|nr:hypothetical protein [Jiella avicenniae]MCE7031014.1 hypothetical protein [Jiella avicenniae]
MTEETSRDLVARAEALGSRTGQQLRLILELGPICGLRPAEWVTAELRGHTLVARCAKYSEHNGRATGETRSLQLPGRLQGERDLLRIGATLMTLREDAEAADGDVSMVVGRLARTLRGIRGVNSRIVLRTTRDQARANMMRAYLAEFNGPLDDAAMIDVAVIVAAAFGHRSTDSQSVYGRTSRGWRSAPVASPDRATLDAVQIGPSMRGKLARGEPLRLLAAVAERHRRCEKQEDDDAHVTSLSAPEM